MQQLDVFISNLYQQLETNLAKYNHETNIIDKYNNISECYFDCIVQLKSFIIAYDFKDLNEEINFFKNIKPNLFSKLFFFRKALDIKVKTPHGNNEDLIVYYEKQLKEINNFLIENQEFYKYFRLRLNQNDAFFFVRRNNIYLHEKNLIDLEPRFCTSHDMTAAQIMCNDLLESFLKDQIQLVKNQVEIATLNNAINVNKYAFEWTDKKSDLIELIYALSAKGSINGGQCEISKIADVFENVFNIELPGMYRIYQDIKNRSSQTKYIDSLKTSLQKKIDEDYQ